MKENPNEKYKDAKPCGCTVTIKDYGTPNEKRTTLHFCSLEDEEA